MYNVWKAFLWDELLEVGRQIYPFFHITVRLIPNALWMLTGE
jgi:hypothetical protein